MNKKLAISIILYFTVVGLYYLGDGSVFVDHTTFKFGVVALVSFTCIIILIGQGRVKKFISDPSQD